MSTKEAHYKKLMQRYDLKQKKARQQLEERKILIYTEIPEIQKIDNELKKFAINISKLVLSKPENMSNKIEQLKNNNLHLQKRKKLLLEQHDYPPNFLELHFSCKKCNDTGYIGINKCSCLKQELINYAYYQSNIKNVLMEENFSNFNFSFYSDDPYDDEKLTPKKNMFSIYKHCLKFVENFYKTFDNLVFYGSTGLGKTFLCNCIAKELLDNGYNVLYLTAFDLFQIFQKYKFQQYSYNNQNKDHIQENFNAVFDVDLLIIDDLGTEIKNSFTDAELFNCLNTRLLNKRSTIISTNLRPNDWKNNYSDRVASRIIGNYKTLKFYGKDIRLQKKYI